MKLSIDKFKLILFFYVFYSYSNYVTCRLDGQLGNQFFQIAHMLAYAWDNNLTPVLPDINRAMAGKQNYLYFHKLFKRHKIKNKKLHWEIVKETVPDCVYQSFDYLHHKNIELCGFFVSSRYFDKYRNKILDLFQLPQNKQAEINNKYKDLLNERNLVAVHIRTGDFSLKQSALYFPGLDFYYQKMSSFDSNTTFLICSDRPGWVKEKMKAWPFKTVFVKADHVTELYLMTQCNHIILSARSTFGYWAAYLNKKPNRRVIAHNGTGYKDWYPDDWEVECFPCPVEEYADMAKFENLSLDNN